MKRYFFPILISCAVNMSCFCGYSGNKEKPQRPGDVGCAELVVNGKSNYEIVVPDSPDNPPAATFINLAAELIKNCLKESSGVELPVVKESGHDSSKPGIFIGSTEFAEKNGISVNELSDWAYIIKNMKGNIIIAGRDYQPVGNPKSNNYKSYILGTLKGTTSFLEKQVGVKFLLPGTHGIEVPKRTGISVGTDLNIREHPLLEFISGPNNNDPVYAVANNYFSANRIKLYGGHSYYDAVPVDKYLKTNPEYFALIGGVRSGTRNHLCISNPDVQELLYKEMLAQLDRGYAAVELGQTDAYTECECENCKKLYGVSDTGEKLWILHRDLAARVLKARPGKKVIILSYGHTLPPPGTFNDFPENVMIELSSYNPEDFEKWRRHKVPGGFITYTYNWGYYQQVGLTPQRTPLFAGNQASLFLKNGVKGVYLCGFGELFGMQGPAYYVYGKMLGSPQLNYEDLLNEYYNAAYGNAGIPMRAFFNALYRRLELYSSLIGFRCENSNYPDFSRTRKAYLPDNPRIILAYIYSPDLIELMEKNLKRAENVADSQKSRKRIALVRKEFDYVKNLASIIHAYNAYRIKPDCQNFEDLASLVDERNRIISGFYRKNKIITLEDWPDIKFMGHADETSIKENGRMNAMLGAPFNWNIDLLKKHKVLPGVSKKVMSAKKISSADGLDWNLDSDIWKNIPYQDLSEIQMGNLKEKTKFKICYDDKYIYIGFICDFPAKDVNLSELGHDGQCWREECLEIFLDPCAGREKYYHFIFNPVKNSFYEASNGFITDPADPGIGKDDASWNCEWTYESHIDQKENKWHSIVKIPFASLSTPAPAAGTAWLMNIGREHCFQDSKKRELSLWSPNLEALNFHEKESFGELIFE